MQVQKAFDKFDTNGDDRLDYREFCEMIKKQSAARETEASTTSPGDVLQ